MYCQSPSQAASANQEAMSGKEQQQQTGAGDHAAAHHQHQDNILIRHLNQDNTLRECKTMCSTGVEYTSPYPIHRFVASVSHSPNDHATQQQQSQGFNVDNNNDNINRASASPLTREPVVTSWGSTLDGRGLTPVTTTTLLAPVEVRCHSREGVVFNEHEHKMMVDGDSLTLVILDCSPSPCHTLQHSSSSIGNHQQVSPPSASSGNYLGSGSPYLAPNNSDQQQHHRGCDCFSRCYCQTELIIRQNIIPHDHICQHVCQAQTQTQQQSRGNQQQVAPGRPLAIEHSYESNEFDEESEFHRPRSYQYQDYQNYLHPKSSTSPSGSSVQNQQQQRNCQDQRQETEARQEPIYKVQQQPVVYREERNMSKSHNSQETTSTTTTTYDTRKDQRQVQPRQYADSQGQQSPIDTYTSQYKMNQEQEQQQQPRPGKRLVKRWNWNKQEFVMSEVDDEPSPRPQVGQPPQPPPPSHIMASSQSQQAWQQLEQSMSPLPPPSQYNPSWTAYRVPDIESVQTDPIYSDLMQEIQRLEEGTPVIKEPVMEPETFSRPVFGQSITPEYIEVEEYENVEFVCRLIPQSDPSMRIEWTVNGKPLQESNRYTNEHDFGVVRLKIKRCDAEDSGIYQCRAINSLGEAISTASLRVHGKGNVQCETLNPAGLDKIRQLENPKPVDQVEEQVIQQPPKFISHIQDYVEKAEGESVHFECCLNPVDDPDLKTEWFFNGRPLVTGSRFHTIDDFGFIVLDIDWLFPRDTGEYVCRATNKYGTDSTRTVLRVKPDKNIILESQLDNPLLIDKLRQLEFPDVEQEVLVEEPDKPAHFVQHLCSESNRRQFVEGDNVHFEARVGPATDGNLTVEWFHNDKPLISGHRFKPSFDFGHIQLDILYVYAEDSGVYKCVARNATGEDVSQFEIKVTGKPSLVYQSQLPKEMVGGVQKITDMEAMWNRPPDPEEEPEPEERQPPEFVLKPKPSIAFEGSCARFSCRVVANPRPRVVWTLNGQTVVTGSRHKLTYDGMYHLTIPKCQLGDAGKVEVHARNLVGECYCATELKVKRKVDDYRGVLKNSPNPWYDEQSLKVYQRQRSQELTDDEDYGAFIQQQQLKLQMAIEHGPSSPSAGSRADNLQQVIGYMEPCTPDVNLLATTPTLSHHSSQKPLLEPGDLHPVVIEQQVVMAPAPSTIKRAISNKDKVKTPSEMLFHQATTKIQEQQQSRRRNQQATVEQHLGNQQREQEQEQQQQIQLKQQQHRHGQQEQVDRQHVFGLDLPRYSSNQKASQQQQRYQSNLQHEQSASGVGQQEQISADKRGLYSRQQHQHQRQHYGQQQQQGQQEQYAEYQTRLRQQEQNEESIASSTSNSSSQQFDSCLPPPSPESTVHGHEVHSHTHKQLQKEHRANREIVREIIEKEIFEQEHKGVTKESAVRGSSIERGGTPTETIQQRLEEQRKQQLLKQQQQLLLQKQQQQQQQKQQEQRRVRFQHEQEQQQMEQEEHLVQIEDYMVPPEFIHKIQPCQALDGDQGRFECTFKGEPKPTITWYRESKMIKPSNLYSIETDLNEYKSVLIIKRVTVNSNAVFTVKAENQAGSAKSSANLVVETHPLPETRLVGVGCSIDAPEMISGAPESVSSSTAAGGESMAATSSASASSQQQQFRTGASSSSSYSMSTSTSTVTSGSSGQQQQQQQQMEQSSRTRQESPKIKSVITRKLSNEEMVSLIRASPEGMIAPTFLHTIHDTYTKPGELARLDARLLGTQPLEVRWLKDGQRVRADRLHKMVLEGDLYTLLILECSAKDEGTYECIASNRIGEARCEGHLFVSDGRPPSATGVRAPDLMTCYSTSANSQQSYQQLDQQQQATSMSSSSIQQEQQQQQQQKQYYGLSRHQYNPLMAQYTSNKDAAGHQQVQQIAPKLIKRLENQQAREGKSVTLRCQISSFPLAEVHWYKENNQLIKPSKYFRIFKDNDETYCLKILETFPEDQGEYKCVATAPTGHTQVETKATITVIPNSPK